MTKERIVHADGQADLFAVIGAERFGCILDMIAEQFDAQTLVRRRRINQRVIDQRHFLAVALYMNSLSGACPQVDGNDLVTTLLRAVQKWQTHNESAVQQEGCQ